MDNRVAQDGYDAHIIPAETAARMEREGENYKHIPTDESLSSTEGMTIDSEGLLNNYAIEPEMYYEVPGDRSAIVAAEAEARQHEIEEINDTDETGKLTIEVDRREHGVGII